MTRKPRTILHDALWCMQFSTHIKVIHAESTDLTQSLIFSSIFAVQRKRKYIRHVSVMLLLFILHNSDNNKSCLYFTINTKAAELNDSLNSHSSTSIFWLRNLNVYILGELHRNHLYKKGKDTQKATKQATKQARPCKFVSF